MSGSYDCLRRVIGICGSGCDADENNLHCPNYYPCRRVGSDVITYIPSRAREIQSNLLAKLEAHNITQTPPAVQEDEKSLEDI